jgi:hypothetical protein
MFWTVFGSGIIHVLSTHSREENAVIFLSWVQAYLMYLKWNDTCTTQ